MRSTRAAWCAGALVLVALAASPVAARCPDSAALGVARVVEIDSANGPIFGSLTSQVREPHFLQAKEVVLTFDDGPMPGVTRSILDTLDRFCTTATFFSVGRMAIAYPALAREILQRGHTLGTHTWSHPLNIARMGLDRARDQIETGFAAVTLAAGSSVAPFFRFPGLSDSPALLDYLQQRGIAAFTVDVVSNDSYITDPGHLIARTLQLTSEHNGGILLFHDIKSVTARALPAILRGLKERGFSVVHLRAKAPYVPHEGSIAALRQHVERTSRGSGPVLLAVTAGLSASLQPAPLDVVGDPPVASIAPAPKERLPRPSSTLAEADQEPRPAPVARGAASERPTERARPSALSTPWMSDWHRVLRERGG